MSSLYEASDRKGDSVIIDAKYVADSLDDVIQNEDLSRFIL